VKDRYRFIIIAATIALVASGLLYLLHYVIFQDVHHIFIYMLGDFAFIPLEVFLVVIVLERILTYREKQALLDKMNMVIGAFYSEVGNYLLEELLDSFDNRQEICHKLNISEGWKVADFKQATVFAQTLELEPDYKRIHFTELKAFLMSKRNFMLTLLENPNLLEKDEFTDLLFATFHLTEELEARGDLKKLPAEDLEHLATDTRRMYSRLLIQWLAYTEHLKHRYPYLYSLVLRTHPFQENPSPTINH